MLRNSLRLGFVAALTAGLMASGSAQNSTAPANLTVEMSINFIAQSGEWESWGAFEDEGIIEEVLNHEPPGNGAQRGNISVVETLRGENGTFTWQFTRHFSTLPGSSGPIFRTGGGWRMISGTGAYQGITGQGTFEGTINVSTGEIHDTYTGHVQLDECIEDARTGVEICHL